MSVLKLVNIGQEESTRLLHTHPKNAFMYVCILQPYYTRQCHGSLVIKRERVSEINAI